MSDCKTIENIVDDLLTKVEELEKQVCALERAVAKSKRKLSKVAYIQKRQLKQ